MEISPAVSEAAKKALGRAAKACRQIGWFSFWTQLSLSIVSAGILLFSVAFTSQVHAANGFGMLLHVIDGALYHLEVPAQATFQS